MKKMCMMLLVAVMVCGTVGCGAKDMLEDKIKETQRQSELQDEPTDDLSDDGNSDMTEPEDIQDEPSQEDSKQEEQKEDEPSQEDTSDSKLVDGMRPEFKASMDSYEKFIDQYCAFMKKYNKNPSDITLLADYAKMLSQYNDMNSEFEKWGEEDMNDAELKYYLDVSNRCAQKMLDVAQ